METIDKANHFAKVALMVKDHMKVADLDPTVTGGLVGAGIGGIGNLLIRKFLERNKKVKSTSSINDLLLGALGGGALGAGGTYLYNHGMKPDLSKTITARSGNQATLGQIDSAANNANAVEGSQFNRLKNLFLGGGENQAGELSVGSEAKDLLHTGKNTAVGAGILAATPGRHNLIKAVRRYLAPGTAQSVASMAGGKDSFSPDAMMQSGRFSLSQGPSEDALSLAHLNKLKTMHPGVESPPTGGPVYGIKPTPKATALLDHMRYGGEDYAKLPTGSAAQRANLASYIKDPAGTPNSQIPRHYDIDRASAGRNLMTGLTKSLAIGQGARLGNNLWETKRLLGW